MSVDCSYHKITVDPLARQPLKKRGELHGGRSISSTEGETRLRRVDSSTGEEICLRKGRFVYGGGDSSTEAEIPSTEGEIRLRRGRFIYGGGHSSTEGETQVYRTFLLIKNGVRCPMIFTFSPVKSRGLYIGKYPPQGGGE